MHFRSQSTASRRLFKVLAIGLVLPLFALAPAFLVSTFFVQPSVGGDESVPLLQVDEHADPETVSTVLITMSAAHGEEDSDPSTSGWSLLEDADIIKVTIDKRSEAEVISDDDPQSSKLADPQWYTFDVIRNGVEIPEDFVRRGDIFTFSYTHDPSMDAIPTDGDECSTFLRLWVDDEDSEGSQTFIGFMKISDDDSATIGRCSIPWIDTDPE